MELVGAALVVVSGISLSASSVTLHRAQKRPTERAREVVGDSDTAAASIAIPPDMQALLDQLD